MADQVNPMGSLATGPPSALLVATAPRTTPEKTRPAKPPESRPKNEAGPAAPASVETAEKAMEKINQHLQQSGTELKFKVDKGSGRTIFQIVSESSGKVLLQVPSEELLAMARKLREFAEEMGASGVLLDKEG